MSDRPSARPKRARSLIAAAALAALALFAPQAALTAANADPGAGGPTPARITATAQTDPTLLSQLTGAPSAALPAVLTAVGQNFQVTVSLWANGNNKTASFPTPTTVTLTPSGPGKLTLVDPATAVIPAYATSATFTLRYSQATAGLTVTAAVPTGNGKTLSAQTASFPVDLNLNVLNGQTSSLLNGTAGADGSGCAVVDPAHPMCGIISLPRGATGNVALSLGACPTAKSCATGSLVTQLIGNLNDANGVALYTRTSPAMMTIVCDKSICGQAGVPSFRALWSQTAAGPFVTAPACPAKGVIGADQLFCTDTVQSTRDNAGDLLLVVLFLTDLKGMI